MCTSRGNIHQLIIWLGSVFANNTAILQRSEKPVMIQIFFLVYWIPAKAKERNTPKEKMVIVSMMEKAVSVMLVHPPS